MGQEKIRNLYQKKEEGKKITALTAYDYCFSLILDEVGIDIILVGDSLANVVLGRKDTKELASEEMMVFAQAVIKTVKSSLVIVDMPYQSCHVDLASGLRNAERFFSSGADGVKIEWFEGCLKLIEAVVKAGIPVIGHIGLTPQTADKLGGFRVQGRDYRRAKELIYQARKLEEAGCFSLVLECIPAPLSEIITKKVKIPTIGIGAGPFCDGQILVLYDLIGLFQKYRPKFVRQYINMYNLVKKAVADFKEDVEKGNFPQTQESFSLPQEVLERIRQDEEI